MTQTAPQREPERATGRRRSKPRRRRRVSTTSWLLIGLGLLVVLGPLYWMVTSSFKNRLEVTALDPTLFPQEPTVGNYTGLLTGSLPFPAFFLNSVFTATVTAVIATFVAAMAGYSFSRAKYRLRGPLSLAILAVQMLPFVVLIGPLYLLMMNLNLLNTYVGLILGYTTFALPFAAWMMKSFIDGVPIEIEEAARVDGYSRFAILVRVVLPLTVPGLAATAVIIFINSWNNLLYPLTLMTDPVRQTLPPGLLQSFSGQYQFDWGGMMAATTVTSIPLVIAFFAVQRYMVRGLTGGSLAGT
ncbi:MAG TPA: carbohydrate ABC transporter permease [Jiangellaceae bacterium]|nr:carbohydrate ABC transporter permease [Jiangellaceae bacterium]